MSSREIAEDRMTREAPRRDRILATPVGELVDCKYDALIAELEAKRDHLTQVIETLRRGGRSTPITCTNVLRFIYLPSSP